MFVDAAEGESGRKWAIKARVGRGMVIQNRALLRTAVFAVLGFFATGTFAQQLYKCGATFQDRPCPNEDVQKRFSRISGDFSISQVNPDTDKDCAKFTTDTLPFWERMNAGESFEKLRAEVDAKPIGRDQKSQMRDALIALKQYRGTVKQVRSQLESQCMNYKRARGMPTERAAASSRSDYSSRTSAAEARARAAEEREAEARERQARAEDESLARIDEIRARNAARAAAAAAAAAARSRADTLADTRAR
jgi:hypothetical protein